MRALAFNFSDGVYSMVGGKELALCTLDALSTISLPSLCYKGMGKTS